MSGKILSDRAIVGEYYNRLEQDPADLAGALSMKIDSSQDAETHAWLGMPPAMREWIGGKHAQEMNENTFKITNKDYESTIEYHERILNEDKTGQFQVRLNEHVQRVDALWSKLASDLMLNGASKVCYDGQFFFDTDHAEGKSGTQSNKISVDISEVPVGTHGTTTAPSVGEMNAAIMRSIQTMFGFKDDQGEPLNELAKDFVVVVPIPLWSTAVAAVENLTIDQGDTNVIGNLKGMNIRVRPNARLSWTDQFTTFRMDGPVKPFIRQVREEPIVKVLGEGSDHYFETRRKKVSIEMSGAMGYGLWQGAVLTRLT